MVTYTQLSKMKLALSLTINKNPCGDTCVKSEIVMIKFSFRYLFVWSTFKYIGTSYQLCLNKYNI